MIFSRSMVLLYGNDVFSFWVFCFCFWGFFLVFCNLKLLLSDFAMAFPLTFAQDVICCVECGNFADYYCNPCSLKLCWKCTSIHFNEINHANAESTPPKRRFEKPFPECNDHVKKTCEFYCKDCIIPICSTCVTGDHRNHNFMSLEEFLEEKKEELFKEVQNMHTTVLPALKEQTSIENEDDYNNLIGAISSHEELICKAVQEVGSELKSQITQHRKNNIAKITKNTTEENKIIRIVQDTTLLLDRNDPKEILKCQKIRCQVNTCPLVIDKNTPVFKGKNIQKEEILSLFGRLDASKKDVRMFYIFYLLFIQPEVCIKI